MVIQGSNGYKYPPPALSRRAKSKTDRADQILSSNQVTAALDNEPYSLDGTIFKREITPVISHISHRVLLPKD